jgi:nondiscriminating glutamyl-tRNA synthetase
MTVVTRFAPSPTGYLHIGSLRTVLYNYLFAKKNNGKFMLRIEDTDRSRYVEGSIENLLQVLASVGLIADEGPNNPGTKGPYLQSERLPIYRKYVDQLISHKQAYHCFCSSERLDELRTEQSSLGLATKYDGKCRYLSSQEIDAELKTGKTYTVRLAVPKNKEVVFDDIIKGRVSVNTKDVDDQVLLKSDGFPTYHMAVVVDDHLMEITHVIRGEEWVPSTPKHILLYEAFGWDIPAFTHLPLLLGKDKKKLSKRVGDVSVESYLQKWFLPEAILNYISLLWWNPKTTEEIFSMSELIDRFELKEVHKAGAVFDIERLEWFNSRYIIKYETDILYNKLVTYLQRYDAEYLTHIKTFPETYIKKILTELKTRLKRLDEFKELSFFFFEDIGALKLDLIVNPKMKIDSLLDARTFLEFGLSVLKEKITNTDNIEIFKEIYISQIATSGYKNGQILWPLRVALSNQEFSPWALELLFLFWREKSIERIEKILKVWKE